MRNENPLAAVLAEYRERWVKGGAVARMWATERNDEWVWKYHLRQFLERGRPDMISSMISELEEAGHPVPDWLRR